MFDPRGLKLVGYAGNPALADSQTLDFDLGRLSEAFLRERFSHGAQSVQVQPESTGDGHRTSETPSVPASVLIPVVVREGQLQVLLTQRTTRLTKHSGQVAFPGGRQDPEDADAIAAALRESHEEIGLNHHHVEVLGTISQYSTGTGYCITPVVALVQPNFELNLHAHEVDAAFEVPLSFLMDEAKHEIREGLWRGNQRRFYAMSYRAEQWYEPDVLGAITHPQGREFFIWGATAAMLRNLRRFLAA